MLLLAEVSSQYREKKVFGKEVSTIILFSIGFDKVAELLIQKGANFDIVGEYGYTALIWAAQNGEIYFSQILLCGLLTELLHMKHVL